MSTPVHTLSQKSARQRRNVFVWCSNSGKQRIGWRVDDSSPVTISTVYRWVTIIVESLYHGWQEAQSYALFPVEIRPSGVLTYYNFRNGPILNPESQELIAPGDYGIFAKDGLRSQICYRFVSPLSYSDSESEIKQNSTELASKASLSASLSRQAMERDRQCIFSEVNDVDELVTTWIFPPFEGYTLSDDTWLQNEYRYNTNAIDLSEFMVVTNVISGRNDLVTLFWENKLGVDVDDNYRVIKFEGPEFSADHMPLKTHLTLNDGPHRPSDRFLRLHFERCLTVSACAGDVREDHEEQEINHFMEDLGIYDDEVDFSDPRWSTSLGREVHSFLVRDKLALYADEEELEM